MAKVFYTERDIDDLHEKGVASLDLHDNVVLTDLARDRAARLGIRLRRLQPPEEPQAPEPCGVDVRSIHSSIKAIVVARLGDGVDGPPLDAVIEKVLAGLGVA
ncbi:MAG: hypothetical protein LLG06_08155 [Desulfobacteraceae bacterium]|nr:hypothetical protein [Desulfobacteraceae bacterium]